MGGETEFEFMGPHGTVLMYVFLPLTLYFLHFVCSPAPLAWAELPSWTPPAGTVWISAEAVAACLAWFGFLAALYLLMPGRVALGTPLAESGRRLPYKCNGLASMGAAALAGVYLLSSGLVRATWPYDHFVELMGAAVVLSFALSAYLYWRSTLNRETNLAPGGNTGYALYDFFIGRQLNPRDGAFDWKFFCELRPGLIGWVVINFACLAKQYETLGHVTASMWLVNAFQLLYVVDALYNETAILTTMDIVTDGFGFMLAFGDLAWVPFSYTLQARYLVSRPVELEPWQVLAIVAVQCVGLYIFRASNSEKNRFRSNPNAASVAHIRYMKTASGSRLITSGWWGMSRHPNYFGDWLMSIAWSLPCGLTHAWPYYYPVYFGVLLVHRQIRDDEKCRRKYGADWDKYCELVPYRIIPYVY